MRAIVESGVPQQQLMADASQVLRPADNYGGRMAFLWVAPLGFIVAAIFLIVYLNDKKKGGYKAERLEKQAPED
ncbi:MAG: hypothetical protein U5K69_08520 [Balneolaceae bacterium]|nr:hypothetical protein [Balneolaceae bacterium]